MPESRTQHKCDNLARMDKCVIRLTKVRTTASVQHSNSRLGAVEILNLVFFAVLVQLSIKHNHSNTMRVRNCIVCMHQSHTEGPVIQAMIHSQQHATSSPLVPRRRRLVPRPSREHSTHERVQDGVDVASVINNHSQFHFLQFLNFQFSVLWHFAWQSFPTYTHSLHTPPQIL